MHSVLENYYQNRSWIASSQKNNYVRWWICLLAWLWQSFHNEYIYQIIMLYSTNIHNFYLSIIPPRRQKNQSQSFLPSPLHLAKLDSRRGNKKRLFPFSLKINNSSLLILPHPPHIYCAKHSFNTIITRLWAKEFTNLAHYSLVMKRNAINMNTTIWNK